MTQKKFKASLIIETQALPDKTPLYTITNNGKSCEAAFEAEFGLNRLQIQLHNKESNDTQVDWQGRIVTDLNVQIQKFVIDNVDLSDHFKNSCLYITTDDQVEKTYGFMHKNGTITFDYICPPFLFVRNKALIKKNAETNDHANY